MKSLHGKPRMEYSSNNYSDHIIGVVRFSSRNFSGTKNARSSALLGRFLKSRGVFLRGEMCVAIFGGKYQHLTTRIFAFKVCWRNECFMLVMKPDDSTLIANIGN